MPTCFCGNLPWEYEQKCTQTVVLSQFLALEYQGTCANMLISEFWPLEYKGYCAAMGFVHVLPLEYQTNYTNIEDWCKSLPPEYKGKYIKFARKSFPRGGPKKRENPLRGAGSGAAGLQGGA